MRIGIDLGGTTVKAALCTEDGTLLCKDSHPTRTGNAAGLKADMKTLALSLCRAHSCAVEDVTAIGIGVPGSFDKKTCTLRFGTNLGLNNVSFADAFLPEFGCPVHLDNDANCALVKQEEDLQQQLTDMEVAATKRKEAESEKAYQDSLNEKYAKLKKASKENEQQILNEIAELKEKHAKEQLEKDEANQKTALQTQLKASRRTAGVQSMQGRSRGTRCPQRERRTHGRARESTAPAKSQTWRSAG